MSVAMEEVEESPIDESSSPPPDVKSRLNTLKINSLGNRSRSNSASNIKVAGGANINSYADFTFSRTELADAVALLDDGPLVRKSSFSKASNEYLNDNFNIHIGNQSLHTVCRSGDAEMLLRLLRIPHMRKKINALDEDDLSPLHLCAKYNHYKCAKILVQYGASVQVIGYNETTPLHYCAVYRKFKTGNTTVPSSQSANNLNSDLGGGGGGASELNQEKKKTSNLTPNAFSALNKIAYVLKDEEDNQRKLIFLFAKEAKPVVKVNAKDKYGSTALHMASYKANVAAVRDLIACNADINCKDGQGATPLMLAASYSCPEIFRILLEKGADYLLVDGEGSTALHLAAASEKVEIVTMLLEAVKNRSKQLLSYFLGMRNKSMETALHIAVSSNQLPAAKVLLEHGASAMEIQLDNMYYPIHLAAQNGELPMMEAIFEHALVETKSEQKVINVTNRDLQTPLHRAVMFNRVSCAAFLLNKGKREGIDMQEKDGFTPLLLAVSHGHVTVSKLLVESGADIKVTDFDQKNLLHWAVDSLRKSDLEELLKMLAEEDVLDLINDRDNFGNSPAHLAARNGSLEILQVLHRHRCDLKLKNEDEQTPLHLAAKYGRTRVVAWICKLDCDLVKDEDEDSNTSLHIAAIEALVETKSEQKVINVTNRDLQTPLHRAVMFNRVSCAAFLLNKGKREGIDMQEKDGFTPLLLAVSHGHVTVSKLLVESGADIKVTDFDQKNLLHWAVDSLRKSDLEELLKMLAEEDVLDLINDRDNFGNSPAHLAARNGSLEILQVLHRHRCDLKLKNEDEQTPLHLAAKYGRTRVVAWICKLDCDLVKDEDEDSNTSLHIAAIEGHVKVSEVLINYQADVQARNFQQWTPLDCAASKGWVKTARLLLDNDSPIDPMDRSGITPLYLACMNGHADMVKLLLDWDADLETRASDGRNPLDIAIESGSVTCVEAILSHPDRWQDALRNRTPLMDRDTVICDTPLRKLIRTMPDQALKVFSKCIKWNNAKADDENLEMTLLYEFIDDSYSMSSWSYGKTSGITLSDLVDDPNHPGLAAGLPGTAAAAAETQDVMSLDEKGSTVFSEVYEDDGSLNESAHTYTNIASLLTKNHPLSIMVNSKAEHLLRHPLVTILLHYKWNTFGRFVYYANLSQYCFFLIFLTGFMIVTKPREFWSSEFNGTTLEAYIESPYSRTNHWAFKFFHGIGKWLVIASALFNLAREVFQLINKRWAYVKQIVNFLEWLVYLLSLVVTMPNIFQIGIGDDINKDLESVMWQCGAVSLFLAWINLILFIQKFPKFGIYVVMFTDVLQTFLMFFAVFILFIVAFAMGFYCLLQNQEDFSTVLYAILRTMVMMIGEFDYTDTFFFGDVDIKGIWRISALSFFAVFIVVMSIITMNLLVGLAVDDIKAVQENASLQRMAMQVNMALEVEQTIPEWLRRRFVVREQKYYPNLGRNKMWNRMFPNKLDGPAVIQNLTARREPIEEVELKQQRILQTVKSLEKGLREMRNDQEKMMVALTKLAQANGISTEQDDYAGEVNDDEV